MIHNEERRCFCSICGRDITRTMKFYDHEMNRYCYDCFQQREKKPVVKKDPPYIRKARRMHAKGMKPSEIAKTLGITAKEVYKALSKNSILHDE